MGSLNTVWIPLKEPPERGINPLREEASSFSLSFFLGARVLPLPPPISSSIREYLFIRAINSPMFDGVFFVKDQYRSVSLASPSLKEAAAMTFEHPSTSMTSSQYRVAYWQRVSPSFRLSVSKDPTSLGRFLPVTNWVENCLANSF